MINELRNELQSKSDKIQELKIENEELKNKLQKQVTIESSHTAQIADEQSEKIETLTNDLTRQKTQYESLNNSFDKHKQV